MDDEDFLAAIEADNANAPVEDQPKEETPPEPKQEEPKEDAKAPDLIAPTLSEPATPTEPAVPTELTPEPKEAPHAPLTALLDEREKRQKAEAELAQFRQAQAQAAAQQQVPDRDEDPDGYEAFRERELQMKLLSHAADVSERFARKEHGVEVVEAAKKWALQRYETDPLYQQQIFASPDPYEKVVADYRKEQLFSRISDPSEYDAFLAWKQAQGQLTQQPANGAAPPNPTPSIPPRSLASAPSAGGINAQVELSEEDIFNEVIPKG